MAVEFSRQLIARERASVDDLVATGRRYADWFLRGGTTTVEAKSGYGLSLEDEIKILRAIKRLDRGNAATLRADVPWRAQCSSGVSSTT